MIRKRDKKVKSELNRVCIKMFGGLILLTIVGVGMACHSQAECGADECCINPNRPIGKRATGGHCQPMGDVGASCLVKSGTASTPPPDMVFSCPCKPGLFCHSLHYSDVPLGEMGQCRTTL